MSARRSAGRNVFRAIRTEVPPVTDADRTRFNQIIAGPGGIHAHFTDCLTGNHGDGVARAAAEYKRANPYQ